MLSIKVSCFIGRKVMEMGLLMLLIHSQRNLLHLGVTVLLLDVMSTKKIQTKKRLR